MSPQEPMRYSWTILMLRRYTVAVVVMLGMLFGALAASAQSLGTVRVWFLRQADAFGAIQSAQPMIFANGAPIGRSVAGTVFYRDFAPGNYTFTVEPYGEALPTGQSAKVALAPGSETYLQVEWLASWQFGYPTATWSDYPNTFGIVAMSPRLAQAYMRTMTNLGSR